MFPEICGWSYLFIFPSGPPETEHLTPVKERAHCPRRNVEERACATTGRSTETGRTGRSPPPWTQPGAGNERDPCRTSGTGAPALRSESPGRYEQEGTPPKCLIWIYCLVEGAWRDEGVLVRVCVCQLCIFVHVKSGMWILAGVDIGNLTWGWGNNFSGRSQGNVQTNFYKTCELWG